MTPEIEKRLVMASKAAKMLSGPARRLSEMRVNIWYPDQFDGPTQASAAGKLFAYCENSPVGGVRGVLNARRNLTTNVWLFDSADYTEEQVKQAFAGEMARVHKLLEKTV